MKHVILGAGPAGVIAAETIRKHAPHDEIVLIGDEPEAPYSRMAIPYLLIGNIGEAARTCATPATTSSACASAASGRASQAVDTAARTVVLEDGSVLAFDRLLIATGSSPATPPIPGIAGPGVHSCWTLADARAIMALAKPGARVLQMGAGFIGCIIMEALAMRAACKLSVVEMGDRMVPRMMGPTAGGMIKAGARRRAWQGREAIERAHRRARRRPSSATPRPVMKVKLSTARCWRPTWSSAPPASSPTSASWSTAACAAWWAC
jgi:NADPH-dependent 2,4-dienoyl-CoA reductase/sulfur reductase-like enzyme